MKLVSWTRDELETEKERLDFLWDLGSFVLAVGNKDNTEHNEQISN